MNLEKNEAPRIGKDAVILTIAKIITTCISLLSAMLLSRFRSLEEYGTYSQLLIIINLTTSLLMLGLPNSINYFLARADTPEEREHFLSVYYTLNSLLCILMGIVLVLLLPIFVSFFNNPLIRNFCYILVILPWTKVTISSISNVLVVYGKTGKLMMFNTINAAVALVSIIIVKLFNGSFQNYMIVFLCGEIIMAIWVYAIVWNLEHKLVALLDKQLIKKILKYSIPIGLSGIVGTLMLEADKLIIGNILDTESLAIYSNAAKELPFTMIATSLTAVLVPQVARGIKRNEKLKSIDLWKKTVEISFIFMMFVVMALVVFAPQVMTILYSEKYLAGTGIFRIYAIILLVRVTSFGIVLNATGKTSIIFYNSILALVINVILDYCLYYVFGFTGPALATMLTLFVQAVILLLFSAKVMGMTFRTIFPWLKLMKHLLINVGLGIASWLFVNILKMGTSIKDIVTCIVFGGFITVIYIFIEKKNISILWKELNG